MAEPGAWTPRRILETALAAAAAALILWCGWGLWHDRRLAERFTRVQLGMDRGGVEAVLGGPAWEGPCTGYVGYLPRADCALELGYSSAFAPIRPAYYMVQLDRRGRVIEAEPIRTR
ncbi:MAG TPA: hypothetical protein VF650_03885 [Allosphingosinicella sp.]|jgi:hypothetical protein